MSPSETSSSVCGSPLFCNARRIRKTSSASSSASRIKDEPDGCDMPSFEAALGSQGSRNLSLMFGWFFEKPLLCQIGARLVKLPECSVQGDKSAGNGADHGCSAPHAYDNWPYLALERDTGVAQALVQEAVDFAETLTESDFGCSSELDYRPIE